ncbi:hypothetical protein BDY21DRAFT_47296 [Lineolata rhizophorae]|uniref:Uncharacterized protein n=1 Tax=Lineolata rhizophorae TaxID=578093 RepID=A0A6A6NZM5_9PEZI|nr:hypothetical protein BDY21DRAFT_47296 [Lineolata rhizophorae]
MSRTWRPSRSCWTRSGRRSACSDGHMRLAQAPREASSAHLPSLTQTGARTKPLPSLSQTTRSRARNVTILPASLIPEVQHGSRHWDAQRPGSGVRMPWDPNGSPAAHGQDGAALFNIVVQQCGIHYGGTTAEFASHTLRRSTPVGDAVIVREGWGGSQEINQRSTWRSQSKQQKNNPTLCPRSRRIFHAGANCNISPLAWKKISLG